MYIQIDQGTSNKIQRMYRQDGLSTEQIADLFGIPELLVTKVILDKVKYII